MAKNLANKCNKLRGPVRAGEVWPLSAFMNQLGIGRSTIRELRELGMPLRHYGRRVFIISDDFITFAKKYWEHTDNGDTTTPIPGIQRVDSGLPYPECLRDIEGLQQFVFPGPAHQGSTSLVYFLMEGECVVYVGQSKHGVARIVQHAGYKKFDSVWFIEVPEGDLLKTERKYITRFLPEENCDGVTRAFKRLKDRVVEECP